MEEATRDACKKLETCFRVVRSADERSTEENLSPRLWVMMLVKVSYESTNGTKPSSSLNILTVWFILAHPVV